MAVTMLGIFSTRNQAEDAITELRDKGYDVKNMSIIMKDRQEKERLASDTGITVGEGLATGAATGAIMGGIAGLLVGIGAITIPGIGALLIGGPLAAALGLTGAAATTAEGAVAGALAGSIVGGLVDLGMPEESARRYEERVKHGGILLAVPTLNGDRATVEEILVEHGATDIQGITMPLIGESNYQTGTTHEEGMHTHQHGTQSHADTMHVQRYLRHVDYPATKDDLLEVAQEEGADEDVMHTLEDLPNEKFESPRQVDRALGRHQ